jgi:FkbM family methyltransferase
MSAWRRAGRFIAGRIMPPWPYPVLRGPLRGSWFVLGAAAGEGGGASIHLGKVEPEQTRCVVTRLNPGGIFFDVGANVGYYSLLAARRVGPRGRVVAFEPLARNVLFLERHLRLNRVANVTIVQAACSDHIGVDCFIEDLNPALGHLAISADERARGRRVESVTLDSVAERIGLRPDMIKIDVEGAELRALRGATVTLSSGRPIVLLSTHSEELRSECIALLAGLGYRVEPLNGLRGDATEFLAYRDSI